MMGFAGALNLIYAAFWLAMAIQPIDRATWLLENLLVLVLAPLVLWTWHKQLISKTSYFLLFLFFVFHTIGSHYTYSKVPWAEWLQHLSGLSVDFKRNDYDRLVHFLFGLLPFLPISEWLSKRFKARPFLIYVLTFLILICGSTFYELIEWAVAETFGGGTGADFLGVQGDEFDAQKDQALAIIGAILAWTTLQLTAYRKSTSASRP